MFFIAMTSKSALVKSRNLGKDQRMRTNNTQPNVDNGCAPCSFLRQVVELGDWVPWEFQSQDEEALSKSEDPEEIVPSPPREGKYGGLKGEQKPPNGEPVGRDMGTNENTGSGNAEVLYIELVCVFARQDLAVVYCTGTLRRSRF